MVYFYYTVLITGHDFRNIENSDVFVWFDTITNLILSGLSIPMFMLSILGLDNNPCNNVADINSSFVNPIFRGSHLEPSGQIVSTEGKADYCVILI